MGASAGSDGSGFGCGMRFEDAGVELREEDGES